MDTPDPAHDDRGSILIVEDNIDNLEMISAHLRLEGFVVRQAAEGKSALASVYAEPPDLILLDIMLPVVDGQRLDGFEISRRIKQDPTLPFIPIILVTARDSTEDKVAGFNAGADDYLTKPIDFQELRARVRSMLRIKALQDELAEKNRQLERLSIHDGLTGLYNHRHIQMLMHQEFERALRSRQPLSVAMLDLDHFKHVNDTYGHQAGDHVLHDVADILRQNAREVDQLGRYGGEEFIAILPRTASAAAVVFVERLRHQVARHSFETGASQRIHMTISAGVATHPHGRASDPAALLRLADEALYAAKRAGRDRVFCYDRIEPAASTTEPESSRIAKP